MLLAPKTGKKSFLKNMRNLSLALLFFVLLALGANAGEHAAAVYRIHKMTPRLRSCRDFQPPSTRHTDNAGSTSSLQIAIENRSFNCSGISFVSREQWGANPSKPENYFRTLDGVPYVFYHHTDGDECDSRDTCADIIRMWQVCHQGTRGWDDIAYNFLIGGDGSVYEGRGWRRVGAHTLGYNDISLSFGFIGNFSNKVPNSQMLRAAEMLIQCGIAMGAISANYTLHGQRDANCRVCPGDTFYRHITTLQRFGGKLNRFVCTDPPGPCRIYLK
uniref:Putative peptidoglycan recognition protein n=1 Tax=Ixodes ricinus TaxID=34613 RepID=A0A6B0V6H6_IXORI